jgi:Winged helix DNA-binding domain
MSAPDIARQRLINQGLVKPSRKSATEVVEMLGAVQSQDFPSGKWAISQRTDGLTAAEIDREFDEGKLIRTHILRPTWHFVAAQDIGWMLALSGPRVHAANAFWYKWLEVDDHLARRSRSVLTKALRDGKHLTRTELGDALSRARITVGTPNRLAAIIMRAELDGVICSGALRGKQFTYALLEERVTNPAVLERDEALAELARRYFTTRGPATVTDFAWWSGLTKADAKRATQAAAGNLQHESIHGTSYWAPSAPRRARISRSLAHLLPNYDEYFVGFKDRSAFGARLISSGAKPRTSALSGHALTINGQIIGGWTRTLVGGTVVLQPKPLIPLGESEKRGVEAAGKKFGRFLQLPIRTRWPQRS